MALAGEMGIGIKGSLPILGTVSAQYVPKADAQKSLIKLLLVTAMRTKGSGMEVVVKTALGDLPVVGGFLDGKT